MTLFEMFQSNIRSLMVLAFAFGTTCRLIRSELVFPRELYASISIYLLFALGIKGDVELAGRQWAELFWPAAATIGFGCVTPVSSFVILRSRGKSSIADAAGIAAHYGSLSTLRSDTPTQIIATRLMSVFTDCWNCHVR